MRISALVPEPREALAFSVVKQRTGKNQKLRTLAKPSPELKELHWALKERLEQVVGKVRLSPVANMLAHAGSRHFYQFDIKDAFPTTSPVRLAARLFVLDDTLGDIKEIQAFLERYCMVPGLGLAQGAPASSILFEINAAFWLDEPITALLGQLESRGFPRVVYSRYVDDLTFSSQEEMGQHVRYKLREIVRRAGYCVHPNKSWISDRQEKSLHITGGELPPKGAPRLEKSFYDSLEAQLNGFLGQPELGVSRQALEGSLAWFFAMERRIEGARRNRQVRRLARKAAQARVVLGKLRAHEHAARKERLVYPKWWLVKLRNTLPIVPYVRKHLPHEWAPMAVGVKCPCPFCGGGSRRRHTFTASDARQSFHCYREGCKKHGDVIAFAMLFFKLDFVAAVKRLTLEAGLPPPHKYHATAAQPQQPAEQLSLL